MKTFLWYGSFAPICLLAWLVASSLPAQHTSNATPNRIAHADDEVLIEVSEACTEAVEQPQAFRQGPRAAGACVASFQSKAFDVKVVDGVANVIAQVSLSSTRTDIFFIWRLSLLDGNGKRLDTRLYDRQSFGMEAPGTIEPTFGEIVKLAPDAKTVQLSLYTCARDTDPATFLNDEKADGLLALRHVEKL